MAFATIHFKGPNGIVKDAPVGFSWTTFFFGFFPALIRGDWMWALIMIPCAFVFPFISNIVFSFIYNRIYIKNLIKQGYKVSSYTGNKQFIEMKAQIRLKR